MESVRKPGEHTRREDTEAAQVRGALCESCYAAYAATGTDMACGVTQDDNLEDDDPMKRDMG